MAREQPTQKHRTTLSQMQADISEKEQEAQSGKQPSATQARDTVRNPARETA